MRIAFYIAVLLATPVVAACAGVAAPLVAFVVWPRRWRSQLWPEKKK